jgi:AcrR family transcriptional regulator
VLDPLNPSGDDRILWAVAELTAANGFNAVNSQSVAAVAGVSETTVREHFFHERDYVLGLWEFTGRHAFEKLVKGIALSIVNEDFTRLQELLLQLGQEDTDHFCLRQLLLMTASQDELHRLVRAEILAFVTHDDEVIVTQRTIALVMAMGCVATMVDVSTLPARTGPLAEFQYAVAHPSPPATLPPDENDFMELQNIVSKDATTDAVLNAGMHLIADKGYRVATMKEIRTLANVSDDEIFSRYQTKLDILIDIVERRLRESRTEYWQFREALGARIGEKLAEAVMWRGYFSPRRRPACCFSLEKDFVALNEPRLAARIKSALFLFMADHLAEMGEAERDAYLDYITIGNALADGLTIAAVLYPEASRLPFDIITMSMVD